MDLAKVQKTNSRFPWTGFLLNLPALYFIVKTVIYGVNSGLLNNASGSVFSILAKTNILSEFKNYRNLFYSFYTIAFIIIGFFILSQKFNRKPQSKDSLVGKLLSQLIKSLILLPFSYTIACVILAFYVLILKTLGGL